MKFPHLKLLFLMALLALTSCDQENVELSHDQLTEDATIGMRCCDGAVSDMVEDPRFHDFYDEFTNGVFDPAIAIFDEFDSEELAEALVAYDNCISAGGTYQVCMAQSQLLTRLLTVIESFDMETLLALLDAYGHLNEDELNSVILEAIDLTSDDSGRNLQCFQRFRVEVAEVLVAGGAAAGTGVGAPVSAGLVVAGLVIARMRYCNCLHSNYGAQC